MTQSTSLGVDKLNKRQKKKEHKKYMQAIEEEFSYCQECGKKLDLKGNEYHRRYGTCNSTCYLHMVGMSWSDFY
jgi:hypothetical protein